MRFPIENVVSGAFLSKDILRRFTSSSESRCAFTQKFSVSVVLTCMSDTDVGSGIGGTGVLGRRGSLNSSSLGLALSAGRI